MKIVGIATVILTSTLIGFMLGQELSFKVKNLKMLKKVMTMLHGEIRFAITPIPEALDTIADKSTQPYTLFLKKTADELKQLQVSHLSETWEKNSNLYLKGEVLNSKELEKFNQLGSTLGYLDKEMQLSTIEQYVEQLEEDISIATEYSVKQGKLYRTLGLLFGILVAIIFI